MLSKIRPKKTKTPKLGPQEPDGNILIAPKIIVAVIK